jgi:hypothetical protein
LKTCDGDLKNGASFYPRPDFQDLIPRLHNANREYTLSFGALRTFQKSAQNSSILNLLLKVQMGNTQTSYTLQCYSTYKVIAKFDTPIPTSRGKGIKCTMAYLYKDFNQTDVTDIWYKEIHDDGSFSLYVKDPTGMKWYINEHTESYGYTYWGCFTEDVISPPRRFTVEDGKITIQCAPPRLYIGMAKWYMGFKVIECLRTDDLFVDPDNGKDYYAFPVIEDRSVPLELVETTLCRRLPALTTYFTS